MGSYKHYKKTKDEKLISRMINSFYYFYKYIFILKENNNFRLVIIKENQKNIDKEYNSMKGAKIACARWLKSKSGKLAAKPIWSFFYPPDEGWLKNKLNQNVTSTLSIHQSKRNNMHAIESVTL